VRNGAKEEQMGRMQRSFQLVGQSDRVLMQDTALRLLPLMSGIVMAVVVAVEAVRRGGASVEKGRR